MIKNFKTRDVFAAFRLLKASHLRDELIPLVDRAAKAENIDLQHLGINAYFIIAEALADKGMETGLYELLADKVGMTPEEFEDLDADVMVETLKELGEKSNIKAFFGSLSALISSKS